MMYPIMCHLHGLDRRRGCIRSHVDSTVDENWAKQHHVIWYEREVANGNIPKPPEAGKTHPAAAVGKVHPAE